jgi:NAD(P)-dependent dehydrogenase (short-subunit alcohol dehydrogenase family)
MEPPIQGRVVVTGASSDIGRATALAFARQGARLVLAARRTEKLEEAARACGAAGGIAEDVADAVLELTERPQDEVIVGGFGKLAAAQKQLAPHPTSWMTARVPHRGFLSDRASGESTGFRVLEAMQPAMLKGTAC